MKNLTELYVKFLCAIKSEKGQTLVEYALLLVLIAIVVIAILGSLGKTTCSVFEVINTSLKK